MLSILCTAIQHGKMPQVGIRTKILECLYSLKVRWQRPLSVPFLFCTSGKGTDKITSFTCALIGLHHCWVWQPCEVMTFCKHLDDTRKSDSFNQVDELKKFWQVQMTPWHVTRRISENCNIYGMGMLNCCRTGGTATSTSLTRHSSR